MSRAGLGASKDNEAKVSSVQLCVGFSTLICCFAIWRIFSAANYLGRLTGEVVNDGAPKSLLLRHLEFTLILIVVRLLSICYSVFFGTKTKVKY